MIPGKNTLLLAIGNDGREDDGLGWAFAREIESWDLPWQIEYRFQLQVEDADLIRRYETVLFVDASRKSLPGGFQWKMLSPAKEFQFSTHALAPATVLAVCRELYDDPPAAFILALEGQSWELRRGLSETGERHLRIALDWFKGKFAYL
jgi:hydrogenase maturation protease